MTFQLPSNIDLLRTTWRVANSIEYSPGHCYKITNVKEVPTFYVMDVIGAYENDAADFVKAVHSVQDKEINLFINSPGGFVWDVMSMYEALLNSAAKVNVEITGLAASAASVLAMSGDSVRIAEAGRMMLHDAQGIGIGSPSDMQEYTDLLHAISDDISGIYAKRTGTPAKTWRKAMTATTWYSSSEAIDAKLADGITESKKDGPSNLDNRTRLIQARNRVLVSQKGK